MNTLRNHTDSPVVVITGVTRGLGRALLQQFAQAGWTVVGCGRNRAHLDELQQTYGEPHRFAEVDVASPAQVEQWARECLAAPGPPDLLLNNAALINEPCPLWEIPPEEFTQLINVNLAGTFHTIRAFLPAMIARQTGMIVNFSSGWGRSTSPDVAPYCATKWAVEGLTQALAQELPPGLAAVALNPGIIDTDMLRRCWSDSAGHFPGPDAWSRTAFPFLLQLSARDNGRSLTVPGQA